MRGLRRATASFLSTLLFDSHSSSLIDLPRRLRLDHGVQVRLNRISIIHHPLTNTPHTYTCCEHAPKHTLFPLPYSLPVPLL